MEGSTWSGISGVPGLGYSVPAYCNSYNTLHLWEEGSEKSSDKITMSDKIAKFFSFRRKKTDQPIASSLSSHLTLPKVPVQGSASTVAVSNRAKVFPCSGDEKCQKLANINSKSNIKRSVSLFKERKCEVEQKKKKLCSEILNNSVFSNTCLKTVPLPPLQLPSERMSNSYSSFPPKEKITNKTNKVNLKSQATQTETDIIENIKDEDDNDYAYSNWISPPMLIKLVEQLELKEDKKVENVYEEIIPREKKIGRSNSLFLSKRGQVT